MIEKVIRKMYILWSGICLVCSAGIAAAFLAGVYFQYQKFMFYLAFFMAALPFFFGMRLLSGAKRSKAAGVIIMALAFVLLIFFTLKIWS